MTASPRILVHATAVVIGTSAQAFGGRVEDAVLLLGPSGSGKSDLALRLISIGAELVADDQTALFVAGGRLVAECPPALCGKTEIRGFGIVRMGTAMPSSIILAVKLDAAAPPRLPEPRFFNAPSGLPECKPVPLITLNPFEASAHAKIAAIAAAIAHGGVVAGAVPASSGSFL